MSERISIRDLPEFDLAGQLKGKKDIATYLAMVIEEGDTVELAHALGVAARAHGMSDIAKASGMTRQTRYRAL